MAHLLDPTVHELEAWLSEQGELPYRARQVRDWIFQKRATTPQQMTDLPARLRDELASHFCIWTTSIAKHRRARDGSEKLVLQLADGGNIECVLLRDGKRRTICISSQVGCAMGCVFCASGLDGVDRNLSAGEMVEQMLRLQQLLPADERLTHVVVMGMGEPLANLEGLMPALEVANNAERLGISARRITISTVGLPAAIRRLTRNQCRYHLAVSLHAPNDELRSRLVPVNRRIGLDEILAAADEYFDASGRRLTFEYVLLGGINDQPSHAASLVRLLVGRSALVNLIPYNPVAGLPYCTPGRAVVARFSEVLERGGLNVQVRHRKGDMIDAACGQLRRTV